MTKNQRLRRRRITFSGLQNTEIRFLNGIEDNSEVLKPKRKLDELKTIISEAEDISISRLKENLPWGIEVPEDPEQVFYVWFDALTNYVNVIGFGEDEEKLHKWWPGIQLFGPDNLRFQGSIWQGMLASVGLAQSKRLLEHGMVLGPDGRKMSKTLNNVISPFDQEKKFGAEVVRFYLLTGIATFADSAYKEEELINMYNSRLANNFGNLLNRTIHLANSKEVNINNVKGVEQSFKKKVDRFEGEIKTLYDEYELSLAGEKIDELADWGNKYNTEKEPWEKSKEKEEVETILNNLSYLLFVVSDLYEPIIPVSAVKAKRALEKREKIILFEKIS